VRDDATVVLLVILTALFGAVVWSVWRHRVVEDLHAIREMLERREAWEREVLADLDTLRREAARPDGEGNTTPPGRADDGP
jgi:hypothetical protein